ncbi:ATP-dependent DNA ligase, partial [Prescottella equi]
MSAAKAPPAPMLATLGEPPADEGWAFEMRWDGQRAVTEDRGGTVRMFSRTSNDITGTFPELTKRVGWIAVTAAVGVSSILAAAPTAGAQS